MPKLTRYEQETIISFNEQDAEALVYTYNAKLKRKLDQLHIERPESVRNINSTKDNAPEFAEYAVPKQWVTINPKRTYNLTEEQRAQLAQRAAAMRKAKGEAVTACS